ncbi:MAG: NAD-dependent DNA ligase LigA [Lachnospiraceae bacterium]|nr:NAD-dependent DNA ligase LigA [Lachnospiraceae bacterium]
MEQVTQEQLYEWYDLGNRYGHYYHDLDSPLVPDEVYDELMQKIKKIEAEHPEWVRDDSPTKHVSGTASKNTLGKVPHPEQMQSLDDKFSFEEVEKWYNNYPLTNDADKISKKYDVEAKIDGLSVALEYVNGKFVQGSTRGDGWIGEDVTENLRRVKGIPMDLNQTELAKLAPLPLSHVLRVRAEVVMYNEDFERVNKEREENDEVLYANPRNAAAGTLRVLDPDLVEKRGLTGIAFSVLHAEGFGELADEIRPGRDQLTDLKFLEKLGFITVPHFACDNLEEIWEAIETIGAERVSYPYWTDGAVVKVNSIAEQNRIGVTTKFPRWGIAYKYKSEEKTTKVTQVIVQTGRTGVLTPKVEFEPVELGGSIVRYATLHNPGHMKALGGIAIGDEIDVSKAAEIIPQVLRVHIEKRRPEMQPFEITTCPSCGAKAVTIIKDEIEVAYCPNMNCPAQKNRYFQFVASRDVLDIMGMGPAVVNTFIQQGFLNELPDIYKLSQYRSQMIELPGLGEKAIDKLLAAIERCKEQPLHRVITSFGIQGCGNHVGKILENTYPDMEAITHATEEELIMLEGIGDITAKAIVEYFNKEENLKLLAELKNVGATMTSATYGREQKGGKLDGLSFVLTGTLTAMTRNDAKKLIEENGGTVLSAISKNTDYLVAGEKAGSKLTKAANLGVKVLTETEFHNMLGI